MGGIDFIRGYLQKQDRFGQWAKFNYRGKAKFGTCPGGCASFILWTFSTVFLWVQLYGFFFEPSYSERGTTSYVSFDSSPTYTFESGDFIPTFYIRTPEGDDLSDVSFTYNNADYFNFYFEQIDVSGNSQNITIPAVNCDEYISGENWKQYTEFEKRMAREQL